MFKKLSVLVALVAILSFPQAVLADGSVWGSIQSSPVEDDNVIGTLYGEKSYQVWKKDQLSLSPFVSGTLVTDTKGYDWNNKVAVRIGGKLNYELGAGVLTLRAGAAHEHLYKADRSYTAPFLSAEYWVGWGYGTSTPGSSWGVLGNISPSEKGNVIAMAHVEQGFLAFNAGGGRVTPFVDLTIARDTKDFDWNNKEVYGLGVKYLYPVGKGSFNVGVKAQREVRSTRSGSGLVLFADFWFPL